MVTTDIIAELQIRATTDIIAEQPKIIYFVCALTEKVQREAAS